MTLIAAPVAENSSVTLLTLGLSGLPSVSRDDRVEPAYVGTPVVGEPPHSDEIPDDPDSGTLAASLKVLCPPIA